MRESGAEGLPGDGVTKGGVHRIMKLRKIAVLCALVWATAAATGAETPAEPGAEVLGVAVKLAEAAYAKAAKNLSAQKRKVTAMEAEALAMLPGEMFRRHQQELECQRAALKEAIKTKSSIASRLEDLRTREAAALKRSAADRVERAKARVAAAEAELGAAQAELQAAEAAKDF